MASGGALAGPTEDGGSIGARAPPPPPPPTPGPTVEVPRRASPSSAPPVSRRRLFLALSLDGAVWLHHLDVVLPEKNTYGNTQRDTGQRARWIFLAIFGDFIGRVFLPLLQPRDGRTAA